MLTSPLLRSLLVLLLAAAGLGSTRGESPRDALLRLVPEEHTFTVVVQNLGARLAALKESPFVREFRNVPLGKLLIASQDPEGQKQVEAFFRELELTPEQLVQELLGDAVVLVFRDADPATRREAAGTVFLQASNGDLLARVVQRLNQIEQQAGGLKGTENREHRKQRYVRRIKANPTEGDEFYLLQGNRLIFATDEQLLREVIDRDQTQPRAEDTPPALARQFRKMGVDQSLLLWSIRPGAFDREFARLADQSQGIEKALLQQFQIIWKGLEGVVFHLDLQKDLELGVMLSARQHGLPRAVQAFFQDGVQPSSLWQVIPEKALFALATRIEGSSFVEMLSGMVDPASRQRVESALLDLLRVFRPEQIKSLPTGLGPDLGFWVCEPLEDPRRKVWVPQMMLAIKLRGGAEGTEAGESLQTGMALLANLLRLLNGNISVARLKDDGSEITYLMYDRGFPAGFRPAFASKGGYFLLSASPESIRQFQPPKPTEARPQEEALLLRLSIQTWQRWLGESAEGLAEFLAQGNMDLVAEYREQITQLSQNLQMLDRMELVQRSRKDCLGLVIRLKTTAPLQK